MLQEHAQKKALLDIYFDRKYYPRVTVNEDLAARYAVMMRNGVQFPPIDVNQAGIILDGVHRYLANRMVHKDNVEEALVDVRIHDITGDEEIMRFAIESNLKHGDNLKPVDFRFIARKYPGLKNLFAVISRFGFAIQEDEPTVQVQETSPAPRVAIQPEKNSDRTNTVTHREEFSDGDGDGFDRDVSCETDDAAMDAGFDGEEPEPPASQEAVSDSEAGSGLGELCPTLASLGMRNLMTMVAEQMLRSLTISEQKALVSRLDADLDSILCLTREQTVDIKRLIKECREDGIEGDDLVARILGHKVFSTDNGGTAKERDPWFGIKIRVGGIRERISKEDTTTEEKIKIIDWAIAQFTDLMIKVGGEEQVKPHSFAEYPHMVQTRTVEVENGIM